MTAKLTRDEAREYLVGQAGLRATTLSGPEGARRVLEERRCIQLDPLDKIGTNADLVVMARVDGVRRSQLWSSFYPGFAFEHWAKERCILPASAFPYYRDHAPETAWWGVTTRLERLPEGVVERVLAEVEARGPVAPNDLTDHGGVERMDWSGWKGTGKAATMAIEVLWTHCRVVTCGRTARARIYDVPSRALPHVAAAPRPLPFDRWALVERVEAAGLLSMASGPHWSMLSAVRTSDLPKRLIAEGVLEDVQIEGSNRVYLAPKGFRDREFPQDDGRMRILGPLDPVLWDRKLVQQVFGFDYVWEVYKPAEKRIWGWYVVPLLHEGRLVGRMEAHAEGGELVVDKLWKEDGQRFSDAAYRDALARHAALL
jgi:uncharacterized protein YcaQ